MPPSIRDRFERGAGYNSFLGLGIVKVRGTFIAVAPTPRSGPCPRSISEPLLRPPPPPLRQPRAARLVPQEERASTFDGHRLDTTQEPELTDTPQKEEGFFLPPLRRPGWQSIWAGWRCPPPDCQPLPSPQWTDEEGDHKNQRGARGRWQRTAPPDCPPPLPPQSPDEEGDHKNQSGTWGRWQWIAPPDCPPPPPPQSPDEEGDHICPVCFEAYDSSRKPLVITLCGHGFCRDCLLETTARFQECSVCRRPLAAGGGFEFPWRTSYAE